MFVGPVLPPLRFGGHVQEVSGPESPPWRFVFWVRGMLLEMPRQTGEGRKGRPPRSDWSSDGECPGPGRWVERALRGCVVCVGA